MLFSAESVLVEHPGGSITEVLQGSRCSVASETETCFAMQAAEGQRQYPPQGYYGNYAPYPYGYPPPQQAKVGGGIPAYIWIAVGLGAAFLFNKVMHAFTAWSAESIKYDTQSLFKDLFAVSNRLFKPISPLTALSQERKSEAGSECTPHANNTCITLWMLSRCVHWNEHALRLYLECILLTGLC